jgi:hypothetical protein
MKQRKERKKSPMGNQPDFAADLGELATSVKGDVSKILNAVKVAGQTSSSVAKESGEIPAAARPPATPRVRKASITVRSADDRPTEEAAFNVTTRLKKSTNQLLTDAALHQRLKKQSPATRQHIIEEALWDWFKRHGYAKNHSTSGEATGQAADEEELSPFPK